MGTDRALTPLVAALTLVAGFGVAQGTGNRALGGVVLAFGAAWCGWRWWRAAGPLRAALAVGVFVVAFAVSHPLARAIGAWPSVLLVAAVTAVVGYMVCAPASSRA